MKIEKLLIPILFIILFVLMIFAPYKDSFTMDGSLYINEVMASNKTTVASASGKYFDYIELYNGYDYDVNLEGYYLTDDYSNSKKFRFPDKTIKAHEYMIIYASGLKVENTDEMHVNFKISSKGETLILFDTNNNVLSKISVNPMPSDISYGYNGTEYVYYYNGTPGKENTGKYSKEPIRSATSDVEIKFNEYIINNVSSVKNSENKYYSIIELYNAGKKDVNLDGYYLTDDESNLTKYTFKDTVIKSDDYLVLYASGLDKKINDEIHLNINLENKDKTLILSNQNKKMIDKIKLIESSRNIIYGKYGNNWYMYTKGSFGKANSNDYIDGQIKKEVIINEVGALSPEAVELKNITDETVNLKSYSISDKSGKTYKFGNVDIGPHSCLSFSASKLKFSIGMLDEVITLYKDGIVVDTMAVHKLKNGVSTGYNDKNEKVFFKATTFGKENSKSYYVGYAKEPEFSKDGGYVKSGTKIELKAGDGSKIYYTTDGNFPNKNSKLYTGPITISKNTVIKAIAYKDKHIESDIVSRTFLTGRKHDLAVVSISTNNDSLYGSNGLFTNYTSILYKKISLEFYENDGSYGTSFLGDVKLSGNVGGSRDKAQKAMTVYLRKAYGNNTVIYPFFNNNDLLDYSSLLFRNGGEDYLDIHIFDAALQRVLKGQMDLDMQDYRPVVMYINGSYHGIYNLRDKLNSDYAVNKFGADKDTLNVIKYRTPTKGSYNDFQKLLNYIDSHDVTNPKVYDYLKTQIDMQELCNYWIAQSYYGNTDLGNIKYWKDAKGKWRFMFYDIDWSLYYTQKPFNYPINNVQVPAVTYVGSVINMTRALYKNPEFRKLYLSSLGYHLKNTFKPSRVNKIIDELAKEIEKEVPYHNSRWAGTNSTMYSESRWRNNLENLKNRNKNRYNYVVSNIRSIPMSNNEYNKYFGGLK